jgi:hypothetical protein
VPSIVPDDTLCATAVLTTVVDIRKTTAKIVPRRTHNLGIVVMVRLLLIDVPNVVE